MLSVRAIKRAQGKLCNASPLTGDRCPNDIRPVAARRARAVQRVHPHECFRSEVRGPRPLVALPAMRVRAFYAHVPAGHSVNVKCFGVTDSTLPPLQHPPNSSPPCTTTTFCVNYEITQRTSERNSLRKVEPTGVANSTYFTINCRLAT